MFQTGRTQITKHLSSMLVYKRPDRFDFNNKYSFHKQISVKIT